MRRSNKVVNQDLFAVAIESETRPGRHKKIHGIPGFDLPESFGRTPLSPGRRRRER